MLGKVKERSLPRFFLRLGVGLGESLCTRVGDSAEGISSRAKVVSNKALSPPGTRGNEKG